MALNAATLATTIKADFVGAGMALNDYNSAFIEMLCNRLVEHIQTQAVVNIPSVSLVTPGSGVSGPGVGSIT